jgi:hypothetical protein
MSKILIIFLLLNAVTGYSAPTRLLVINVEGGWDPTMVFDYKGDQSSISTDGGAVTSVGNFKWVSKSSRPSVDTFMSTYANQLTIVNGIYTKGIGTSDTLAQMTVTKQRTSEVYTDYLTWYAAQAFPTLNISHLLIDAPSVPGDLQALSYQIELPSVKRWQSENTMIPSSLVAFNTWSFENSISKYSGNNFDSLKLSSLFLNQKRALTLRGVFSGIYDTSLSDFKNRANIALVSFKNNLSGVSTIRYGSENAFDTRHPSTSHFIEQNTLYEALFSDLGWLITELKNNGLGDNTIVVIRSNLGKNPILNSDGGKNPWPYTSLLIWSPLWKGGRVVGKTDANLMGLPIDPIFGTEGSSNAISLTADNIFAAIFNRLSIPPSGLWANPNPALILFQENEN